MACLRNRLLEITFTNKQMMMAPRHVFLLASSSITPGPTELRNVTLLREPVDPLFSDKIIGFCNSPFLSYRFAKSFGFTLSDQSQKCF